MKACRRNKLIFENNNEFMLNMFKTPPEYEIIIIIHESMLQHYFDLN